MRSPDGRAHAPSDRILLIAPSWVGDAILSEPLIAQLRRSGVEQPIDVIVPPWCGPVYARMRGVGRIIDNPAAHRQVALRARRALGRSLRENRYTHAYVLPNTWKSALVPFFADIRNRIGYVGEARFGLLTEARKLDLKALPQLVARYAALATAAGAIIDATPAPQLVPNAENLRAAMHALRLSNARPVAILCPGAEFGPAKRWPAEHFAALAQRLSDDGHSIWILGSPNDRAVAAALIEAQPSPIPGVIDLTGRTDLGTAIDLMSVASLVVSNDSGLMHAAAAVNAPLVALFGSSSPAYTPPLSPTARIAKIDIACSPCFKRECPLGHFRCMRELSPELVYNLARAPSATPPPGSPR
ncbi:MAG: lipopolysaccharide heptosyltransferase II [Pseudomonadota bacterium]|nr:lipopolysaccharide heptosyltransferase II [Pseudomonadota bacterium]